MSFKPIQKLNVQRTLATGEIVPVGVLAQNRQGVFFQYFDEYISKFGNLSPFTLQTNGELQQAPKEPHQGIHGVFGDSLPDGDAQQCRTHAQPGDEAWLVKFTSKNLALGHEEGLCEAVYLQMAEQAKCQPPVWQLINAPPTSGAKAWLALKRFDYLPNEQGFPAHKVDGEQHAGRLHMHSACGLLDADFRTPSLDYSDLIKASRQLCKSPAAGQLQFRRAMFNLFAANQDDHSKNWGFLQGDDGNWQLAPFYDLTFSPHPFNEHATVFAGHGKAPPLKVIQKLAASAGFANWKEAQQCIQEVVEAIGNFSSLATQQTISKKTVTAITKTLDQRKQENAALYLQQ